MNETDDRLAGDLVWELFPVNQAPPVLQYRHRVEMALLVVVAWFLSPPLAVLMVCLMASWSEFRSGWQMSRTIPDKMGGRICARFAYAWGAWKFGATAFALMFVVMIAWAIHRGVSNDAPPAATTAGLLWVSGFGAAAVLTAVGLVQAYRSGLRVWIGEGINQARTLLLGMLIVGFTCGVLIPICALLAAQATTARMGENGLVPFLMGLLLIMFGAPVILLIILDRFTRQIVADRPTRFGPKMPAVGKFS